MTLAEGLHHADCIAGMRELAPGSVDFVFADLPYGCTRNAWDRPIDLPELWRELRRVCKPTAAIVFTAVQPYASEIVMSQRALFRFETIWRKNKPRGHLNASRRPLRGHENLLVFYAAQPTYHPQMSDGHAPVHGYTKRRGDGSNYGRTRAGVRGGGSTQRHPTTVLEIPVLNERDPGRVHPTQKPEALASYYIRTYTDPGDLVLDPTAGSGSTLAAAWALGRRAVGFESDRQIYELARARLEPAVSGC